MPHAQQTDDVAGIVVGIGRRRGGIKADVHIIVVVAAIGDVGHEIAARVLEHRNAEMDAYSPIDRLDRVEGVFPDGQAAQQEEAAPVLELVRERGQVAAKFGNDEIGKGERRRL